MTLQELIEEENTLDTEWELEHIAEEIIQKHMLPDIVDSSSLYFEPDRDEIKQDIIKALSSRDTYWKEAWKKALAKRNGGASGLLKVIDTFDGYINKST